MTERNHLEYALSLIKTFYGLPHANMKILDLGCGSGWLVKSLIEQGFDAYGCDIKFKEGAHVEELRQSGRIRLIDAQNYELPFKESEFDIVMSFQVLEHVNDYDFFAKEARRVLRNKGISIHVFPAAWRPLESHIHVPFGAIFQNKPWYYFFTLMGFCKTKQRAKPWMKVANDNLEYMKKYTNYMSRRKIRYYFRQHFSNVAFSESQYFSCSQHRVTRILADLPLAGMVGYLYSIFWRRVLVIS